MIKIFTRTLVILLAFLISAGSSGIAGHQALAAGLPDLVIQEISLSPAEPELGGQVAITVTVKNQGDSNAGLSYVTCYVDESIIGTKLIDSINPGLMATAGFTWEADGGSHVIKAVADINGTVTESDETNNSNTYSITTLASDLIIDSITWSPANPSKGDSVTFTVTAKNQGNANSYPTNIDFFIDGSTRGLRDIPVIEQGKSVTKTYSWIAAAGRHTLKAVADETNAAKESNEENNELTVIFDTSPPDLVIQKITWVPEIPSKDDDVQFTVTVANQGTGIANASHLGYYIDDVFLASINTPELNTGASCEVKFIWKATLDAHKVRAVIDYYKIVPESNEDNNGLESSLTAQPPDLLISNVTWTPSVPAAGDILTVTATLSNRGVGAAEPSRANLYISGKFIGYFNFGTIAAGTTQTANLNWTAESGAHAVSVTADTDNKLIESNEDNNRFNTEINVLPPDLIVEKILYSPQRPAMDQDVTFTVVIKNQGKGRSGSFDVACYMDDVGITTQHFGPLASGASANTSLPWKIQGGHHIFKARADFDGSIMEDNEKNNINSISIAADMPDLVITNVSWSPAEITAGKEITFSIVVKNTGTLDAAATRLVFYADGAVAGFNDIPAIRADASVSQTFTWPALDGKHSISIVADSKDQVKEIDETNNTVVVNIPAPDLSVQGITFPDKEVLAGDKVTITAVIKNNRGSPTQSAKATCYVDDSSLGTNDLPPINAGDTYNSTFEWTAEAGTHTFKIRADVNNTVIETDETNNEAEAVFSTTTPDLLVDKALWQASGSLNSNEVSFTVTLKNAGGCESGPFTIEYYFDSLSKISRDMASIAGKSTAELTFTAILPEGQHTIYINLDTAKRVNENDEANNNFSMPFSTTTPDLLIRSITWGPLTAKIGDDIKVSVKVENRGASKATNARVTLSIGGKDYGSADIAEIPGGSTASADFAWKAAEGEHQITATADSGQTIVESNENNNSHSRTITFLKPESTTRTTPIISPDSTTGGSLLDSWWWLLLVAGGLIGLSMLYTTVKNLKKK